ncbi:btk-binding protein-related [Anaeramoeba flamelloides]|uniref:Btk-binding protein-related n=1 Tax=Anaeramoeba flamelloides TaxID=1746091 RepID=A0ABQ8XNG4_9EUKA|nr:btk-binding protein-related [Anaeramoeba flamelloides]
MSKKSSVYLTGLKDFHFFTKEKNNKLPRWSESNLKKTQTIKKIVCSCDHFLVWKKSNKLEFYEDGRKKKREYQLPKNEKIQDIVSGLSNYLILTESGKVWSLANGKDYNEVPLLDADQSTFEKLRPVSFFEEKKLFVNSLIKGYCSGYYLCNGDQLYASGSNSSYVFGIGQKKGNEAMPFYVQDKVTKIFSGNCHRISFSPQASLIFYFKGSKILTVSTGENHSVLITKKGQTYSCGFDVENGHGQNKTIFTLIPQLKEKKAVQLSTSFQRTLVLTDENELYIWGIPEHLFPTDESDEYVKNNRLPTKISLPSFFTNYLSSKDMIRIASGSKASFLYLDFNNTLSQDLALLFESKKFCDCEIGRIGNQIPVHKALVEFRTKLTIEQIQKKLFGEKSTINKEQTLGFLKWVYCDEISDSEKLEQTFKLLQLTFPPSVDNTLEKDIARLYKDDDSKDFKILAKIEDDKTDENKEDKDEDKKEKGKEEDKKGNYQEIPVHKFILLARSGLFRSMFDYVNEKDNTNKVQDYTRKSIESLEILIKYFYTDSIELTTDQDPELIVEELSDAVEYYQLNEQCNFVSELLKIKKQFDLN